MPENIRFTHRCLEIGPLRQLPLQNSPDVELSADLELPRHPHADRLPVVDDQAQDALGLDDLDVFPDPVVEDVLGLHLVDVACAPVPLVGLLPAVPRPLRVVHLQNPVLEVDQQRVLLVLWKNGKAKNLAQYSYPFSLNFSKACSSSSSSASVIRSRNGVSQISQNSTNLKLRITPLARYVR